MSRPDTSAVVTYILLPRRTDIVNAVGVRLFQWIKVHGKSVQQYKILRHRLFLQRLLLAIFKCVASDIRWNLSRPRCVLSSWSWWWSGLIHITYTVITVTLFSAIGSPSPLIYLISLQANPFTFVVIWWVQAPRTTDAAAQLLGLYSDAKKNKNRPRGGFLGLQCQPRGEAASNHNKGCL
jgi:hypothetical protein